MRKARDCGKGFTLVEIMIAMAVMFVITAIVIPNFIRVRERAWQKICISNLRQIDGAVDQWMFENAVPTDLGVPSADQETEIYQFLKKGRPNCPAGGTYQIDIGANPQVTCTVSGHVLYQ
jgi:prepilin-type N-terminal cleavage/methylation domain-containing protein